MKLRVGVIVSLVLACATPSFAQGVTAFGVKAGLNFSNIRSDDIFFEETDTKLGVTAGGFVRIPVNDLFSIQPEVLFSRKGAKFDDVGTEVRINLDYLEIPVLAHLSFSTGGSVQPFVAVGPLVGLNVNAQVDADDNDEDIGDDVKAAEFGIAIGGGIEFGQVSLEGRLHLGLTNINDSTDEESVKNRSFLILFGYRFR